MQITDGRISRTDCRHASVSSTSYEESWWVMWYQSIDNQSKFPDRALVRIAARKIAGRFAIGGIIAGPVMTAAVMQVRYIPDYQDQPKFQFQAKNLDDEGLYDRCYRLRHNEGQVDFCQISIKGDFWRSTLTVSSLHLHWLASSCAAFTDLQSDQILVCAFHKPEYFTIYAN